MFPAALNQSTLKCKRSKLISYLCISGLMWCSVTASSTPVGDNTPLATAELRTPASTTDTQPIESTATSETSEQKTVSDEKVDAQTQQVAPEKNEDWSQVQISDPQFDIIVDADHKELQGLLREHLELFRFRMIPDLSNRELRYLLTRAEDDIRALSGTLGYFSPKTAVVVVPADERTDKESDLPLILIYVQAGQITSITNMELTFQGDIEERGTDMLISSLKRRLRWSWSVQSGDPFTQDNWSGAKSNMLSRLKAQYYPAGKIAKSQAVIDPEDHTAKLAIKLDSGPRFFLGDYKVFGLQRYSERLVKNFARLKKGEDYIATNINDAQQRLANSGYFDNVLLYVKPDDPTPEEASIHVLVNESYYQRMYIGPGYSTDHGPRLTFQYSHNEVPLLNWQLKSALTVDKDNQVAEATLLSIPDEDFWRWMISTEFKNQEKNDERTKSARAKYGRTLATDELDTAYYVQYDSAKTIHQITKAEVDAQALSANAEWTWRKFDNLSMPRKGWGFSALIGAGSTVGKTTTPFLRTHLRAQSFLPFKSWKNGKIILRGEFAAIFAKEGEPMPTTLLYKTGGDRTVRGYAFDSIATDPYQSGKATAAGQYMTIGSIEYQRPIFSKGRPSAFDWAAFIDTGSVSNKLSDIDLHTGVGAGIRWRSPVGPINADLAYGLKTDRIRVHFNIGFTF